MALAPSVYQKLEKEDKRRNTKSRSSKNKKGIKSKKANISFHFTITTIRPSQLGLADVDDGGGLETLN